MPAATRPRPLLALLFGVCIATADPGSGHASGDSRVEAGVPKAGGALFPAAFLKADNAGPGDQFGLAMAMDGDLAVIGAPAEDGDGSSPTDDSANRAGAAYILRRETDGSWIQEAYLKAGNADASDSFGIAVAISGTRVVIGASGEDSSTATDNNRSSATGAAYVFVACRGWHLGRGRLSEGIQSRLRRLLRGGRGALGGYDPGRRAGRGR